MLFLKLWAIAVPMIVGAVLFFRALLDDEQDGWVILARILISSLSLAGAVRVVLEVLP